MIIRKTREYLADKNRISGKNIVRSAYVVFRSMEGAARFLEAYNITKCQRFCFKLCCCNQNLNAEFSDKFFRGSMLQVKRAVDPSLILWKNLIVTKQRRRCLFVVDFVITIVLLLVTIIALVYSESYQEKLIDNTVQCSLVRTNLAEGESLTEQIALSDHEKPEEEQLGYMYCFCKDIFYSAL